MASNTIIQYSSSSSHVMRTYDVFVSFCGEDTRNNFTDFLFGPLQRKGIDAFKDNEDLRKGESIQPELQQAIEGSRIFVVVFSKNYASSTWCLRELAHICNCTEVSPGRVLPIFYDVDPSDVRKQSRSYEKAFAKYEERFREDKEKMKEVQTWREALAEVGAHGGWDIRDKSQYAEIEKIVQTIIKRLGPKFSSLPKDNLVGMEARVDELVNRLCLGSANDVRVVGISGMSGIGKTTLAHALYEKISDKFDFRCLIDDVSKIYQDSDFHRLFHPFIGLLGKLISVNLEDCRSLTELPHFGETLNLEMLNLKGCIKLKQIHPSIGLLRKLRILNLKDSKSLVSLPNSILCLNSLIILSLYGCSELYKTRLLEERPRDAEHLKKLCIGEATDSKSISSILKRWFMWSLRLWYSRAHKDSSVGYLLPSSLTIPCMCRLDLSYCNLVQIPDAIGNLHCLERLSLRGNNFATLPNMSIQVALVQFCYTDIICVVFADETCASYLSQIQPSQAEVLILNLQTKYSFPEYMEKMSKLKVLIMTNYGFHPCELDNFKLLSSVSNLRRIRLERISVPHLGTLKNLEKLSLYMCSNISQAFENGTVPDSDSFPNLADLSIDYRKDMVVLPTGICDITPRKKLSITNCHKLSSLPQEIGQLLNLELLNLSSCTDLEEIPDSIVNLSKLRLVDLSNCISLSSLPEDIRNLFNLRNLNMTSCARCELPYSVTNLENLKVVVCDEEIAASWEAFEDMLPNLKLEVPRV